MKIIKLLNLTTVGIAFIMLQSCARQEADMWENTKSAGRYMRQGVRAFCGRPIDSRQIRSGNEFECIEDEGPLGGTEFQEYNSYSRSSVPTEYMPLKDQANEDLTMADIVAPPPRETPGEPGSSIPGIEAFRDPSTIPQLRAIFCNIYFEYNSSLIRGETNLAVIHHISDYMRRHPNAYLVIEGHTDERGPQAYNLALGSRRSNSVRNLLIAEGVNPDHLFTISYGKERPLVLEHHEEGWAKNRRAEFKIYER